MATSLLIFLIFCASSVSSVPETNIDPSWNFSRKLTQRINVDLPLPDGPQTTIISPSFISKLMFLSAWKSPYHLFRSDISMIFVFLSLIFSNL